MPELWESITAIEAAYATGEEWLDQLNGYIHDNLVFVKDYLAEHLPKAKMYLPEGTYFAWVDVAPYLKGAAKADLDSFLVKTAGILIESGPEGAPIFGPGGETRLRINTACPRSMLEEGMRRMCQALDRVHPGDQLKDFPYQTPWGEGRLSDNGGKPTALMFLRYYGCTICQLDLLRLKEGYSKTEAAGGRVLVVLQSDPAGIREQIGPDHFPFEIICDPEQELYRRYHVCPALSVEKMADLRALEKIGQARAAGLVHGKYEGDELQLPAVFLLDKDNRVQKAHYAAKAADLPTVEQLADWLSGKE